MSYAVPVTSAPVETDFELMIGQQPREHQVLTEEVTRQPFSSSIIAVCSDSDQDNGGLCLFDDGTSFQDDMASFQDDGASCLRTIRRMSTR